MSPAVTIPSAMRFDFAAQRFTHVPPVVLLCALTQQLRCSHITPHTQPLGHWRGKDEPLHAHLAGGGDAQENGTQAKHDTQREQVHLRGRKCMGLHERACA